MTHPSSKKSGKKSQPRKGKGSGGGGNGASVVPGRGYNIPRPHMGHDSLFGVSQSLRRTLVFAYNNSVTSTTAAYNEATTITLNNVFSPNGGGSAVGFAKYMGLYSKAWVLGARICVRAAINSTAPVACGLTITTNNTSLGSAAAAVENGMTDWKVGSVNPDRYEFNEAVDVGRFLTKPRVLDDPQLFCTAAAGPTQLIVAHLWVQGLQSNTSTMIFINELEFDVVFTDPIPFT